MNAPSKWRQRLLFDVQFADKALSEQGKVYAVFVLHMPNGEQRIAVPDDRWADENRRLLYGLLKQYAAAWRAVALGHIEEAWVAAVKAPGVPGETPEQRHSRLLAERRPRDREDRVEVVIVSIIYYDDGGDRRLLQSRREIQRAANGKASLGREYRPDLTDMVGEVIDILPAREPSPLDQAEADLAIAALEACDLGIKFLNPANPPRRMQ